MVSIRDQIYSIGGYVTRNTMETITLNATGTWNQQSMPFSVHSHCAVVLDNNIIVIGGADENYNFVDTWIYNVVKKDWTEGPKLNEKRGYHACLVDEETSTIHVMGGWCNNGYLKSTEKWIFGTDSWISGASLPEAVYRSAAVNSNSEETIGYLVAGANENGIASSKVWSLRRSDMRWIEEDSKQLQIPRYRHTVVNIPRDQIPGC